MPNRLNSSIHLNYEKQGIIRDNSTKFLPNSNCHYLTQKGEVIYPKVPNFYPTKDTIISSLLMMKMGDQLSLLSR